MPKHKVKLIESRALNTMWQEEKNGKSFRILRKFARQIETATLQEFFFFHFIRKEKKI